MIATKNKTAVFNATWYTGRQYKNTKSKLNARHVAGKVIGGHAKREKSHDAAHRNVTYVCKI